jgi:hypothetical protein
LMDRAIQIRFSRSADWGRSAEKMSAEMSQPLEGRSGS